MDVALRAYAGSDENFLFELYRDTRKEEMAAWGWSDEQRDSVLRLQYGARRGGYSEQFPDARDSIILLDGEPVGRMLVAEADDEIRLVDIAILSQHRGGGIGASLIRQLLESAGKSVRLHVGLLNPAKELYMRLGFKAIREDGGNILMEHIPR